MSLHSIFVPLNKVVVLVLPLLLLLRAELGERLFKFGIGARLGNRLDLLFFLLVLDG